MKDCCDSLGVAWNDEELIANRKKGRTRDERMNRVSCWMKLIWNVHLLMLFPSESMSRAAPLLLNWIIGFHIIQCLHAIIRLKADDFWNGWITTQWNIDCIKNGDSLLSTEASGNWIFPAIHFTEHTNLEHGFSQWHSPCQWTRHVRRTGIWQIWKHWLLHLQI